jgi:hypothetical protein
LATHDINWLGGRENLADLKRLIFVKIKRTINNTPEKMALIEYVALNQLQAENLILEK